MEDKINLSEKARKKLKIPNDKEITEEMLREKCSKYKPTKTKSFEITLEDGKCLQEYMDLKKANAKVYREPTLDDEDIVEEWNMEFQETMSLVDFLRVQHELDLSGREVVLQVNQEDMDQYLDFEIEQLKDKVNLDSVEVYMDDVENLDCDRFEEIPEAKFFYDKNNDFDANATPEESLDSVRAIQKRIHEMTDDIDVNAPERYKFAEIARRVADEISYDHDTAAIMEKGDYFSRTEEENQVINNTQNLNGLISQTTVCNGYARIMPCLLDKVGIEAKSIAGGTKRYDLTHAWNQVKIDGKWYNFDITADRTNLCLREEPKYCLKSDKDFPNHYTRSMNHEVCDESYDKDKLLDAFGIDKENLKLNYWERNTTSKSKALLKNTLEATKESVSTSKIMNQTDGIIKAKEERIKSDKNRDDDLSI